MGWCVFFVFILASNTYAYLDAGTGSYIIQIVIGFFVGGLYAIKVFWKKIILFIHKPGKTNRNSPDKN